MFGNLIMKMVLEANDYDKGMAKCQKSVQGFIQQNMTLGGILGQVGKAMGAAGLAVGAVEGALTAAKKTIAATQTATDNFERSMAGARSAVDSFFYSLSSGNWDDFIGGLKETVKYAKDAYDALDDLGTFNIFAGAEGAEIKNERETLKAQIKSGYRYETDKDGNVQRIKMTEAEIEAAKKRLIEVDQEYIKLIRTTAEKENKAYITGMRSVLKENKFKGGEEELDAVIGTYMKTYKSYMEASDRKKELDDEIAANSPVEKVWDNTLNAFTYKHNPNARAMSIKNSSEYNNLQTIIEIGDKKLEELMKHRIAAAAANAQLAAELRGDEKALKTNDPGPKFVPHKKNSIVPPGQKGGMMSEEEMQWAAEGVEDYLIEPLEMLEETAETVFARSKHEMTLFVEELNKQGETAKDMIGGIAGAFDALAGVVGGTAGDNIKAIGNFVAAAEGMVPVIQGVIAAQKAKELADQTEAAASMQAAAAQGANAVAGVPLAGPALAIAAITSILSMVGAIKAIKFAEGGVVPGNNYTDGIQAKVSAGEVVLNSHDAKNLYDQIHSGNLGGGGGGGYVSGENIYIGLNNYLSRTGKGRLVVR